MDKTENDKLSLHFKKRKIIIPIGQTSLDDLCREIVRGLDDPIAYERPLKPLIKDKNNVNNIFRCVVDHKFQLQLPVIEPQTNNSGQFSWKKIKQKRIQMIALIKLLVHETE